MSNVYLEKIAARVPLNPVKEVVKSVGRVGLNGIKAVGNQIHLAAGGAYREHAKDVMGIQDIKKLSKMNGNFRNKKEIFKHYSNPSKARETITDLNRKQLDARMTVGGLAVGAEALRRKVKEKMDAKQEYSY